MKPVVTIITPVYNRPEIICQTIESVSSQTFTNWQFIIVDDLSTDNTLEVISAYAKKDERILTLKRNREPKGAQTCRNLGLQNAKGTYVIFLDSDDILMPFCLEQRLNFVAKYPNIDLAVFPKKKLKTHNLHSLLICFLSYKLPWQIMDPLWNRTFLNQIEGFDENLPRFQDVNLSIKALLQDNVKLLISDKHLPDSQYLYDSNVSEGSNYPIVYNGLRNLITEVSSLLGAKGQDNLKPYLRFYLRSWLIHYHYSETSDYTKKLIMLFHQKEIISKKLFYLAKLGTMISDFTCPHLKIINKIYFYSLFEYR